MARMEVKVMVTVGAGFSAQHFLWMASQDLYEKGAMPPPFYSQGREKQGPEPKIAESQP